MVDPSISYVTEILNLRHSDYSNTEKQKIDDKLLSLCPDPKKREKAKAALALFCGGDNPIMLDIVKSSTPSDLIDLDMDAANKLISLFNPKHEIADIPLDILYAGTIPIRDVIIQLNGVFNWRVVTCTQEETERLYQSAIKASPGANPSLLAKVYGALILRPSEDRPIELIAPMVGNEEATGIRIGVPWCYRFCEKKSELLEVIPTEEEMALLPLFTAVWYGIQIALLHPLLKDSLTTKPKPIPYSPTTNSKHKKKAKVKYMKHYSIQANAFDELLTTLGKGDRKYTRHTLAWYVIGHFTTLRNGERRFIQGYWKGPLRHMKAAANQDAPIREREIAQLSEEENK